jgi:hypothetical protein
MDWFWNFMEWAGSIPTWVLILGFLVLVGLVVMLYYIRNRRPDDD